MGVTWGRVLVGIGVLACFLGIGALEVLSQRVRVDPAATTAVRSEGVRPEPSGDSLALHHDDLLSLEADPADSEAPTPGVARIRPGAGRLIVLEVADLAFLKPGDVIRIEPSNGQIQRIVLLRPAWREMTSPEQ